MTRVQAFDVNETLIDLAALDPLFERLFGDAAVRREWFQDMLRLVFVGLATGELVTFPEAQPAALAMVAARHGKDVGPDDVEAVRDQMRRLPAHPDARPAIERLRAAGLPIAALTNSPLAVAEAQLANAGLRELFDDVISAEETGRLKPAPDPYRLVASRFAVEPGGVRLIAAHEWDVIGALAAGCRAALIARPGVVASPLGRQPDVVAEDLGAAAQAIVAADA
jgi:2-haloacid dehalogenase